MTQMFFLMNRACIRRWLSTALVYGMALVAMTSCRGGDVRRPPAESGWVLVEVRAAEILETAGAGDSWDRDVSADSEQQRRESVDAVVGVAGLLAPELGPILALFGAMGGRVPNGDADPAYPDVRVRADFRHEDAQVALASTVAQDAIHPQWSLGFYVHLGLLTEEGIRLRFEDVESRGASPASIGEIRITRESLRRAVTTGTYDLHVAGGRVVEASVSLSVPRGTGTVWSRSVDVPLNRGLVPLPQEVPAGSVVIVRASGGGRIGSGHACPPEVTVEGVETAGCERYNLVNPALRAAPHGSAVALVGRDPDVIARDIARDISGPPCRVFIAPNAGPIVVGVNDRDFANNRGTFTFYVEVLPPVRLDPRAWGEDWGCDAPEMEGSWP